MLVAMVSAIWQADKDPDKPIFIDRDDEMFRHLLNYLRYRSIELPVTIPRSMFDRELDYYGVPVTDGVVDEGVATKKNEHGLLLLAEECSMQTPLNSVMYATSIATVAIYKSGKPDFFVIVREILMKKEF